jgi:type 1 glutamine amidotransferase
VAGVSSVVYSNGWPEDPVTAFADAATLVIYSDGGGGHPLLKDNRLQMVGELLKKGVGLVCIHYAVEPTKERGEQEFLDWIGGCFEVDWSVNPTWAADIQTLPHHPITRGVDPFKIRDEWYFHMRFRDGMTGVTPILSAVAPASTMDGFGFTGGHYHKSWGNENVRKLVLNAILWTARVEIPENGVNCQITPADLQKNLDSKTR